MKTNQLTKWHLFINLVMMAGIVLAMTNLASCASFNLEDSIGIGPEDNAILCVRAKVDPAWSESGADYTRIELPASLDLKTLTPELATALVQIAQRLGC